MQEIENQTASEVGQSRRPHEDERLVRGQGQYLGDIRIPGTLHLSFVRSPYAHARISRIDVSQAASASGVVLILSAADLPGRPPVPAPSGGEFRAAAQPFLAVDVVHAIGTPVVAVVAESAAQAVDAAVLVQVEYEPLDVVVDPTSARAPDAPLVHPELGTNVAFTLRRSGGDVAAAFAAADQIVSERIEIPRLAGMPLEPLGILANWDRTEDRITAWCTTQAPWRIHNVLAGVLGLPPEKVRVIAPNVGGGFGVRGPVYVEYIVTAIAARRLGRPVRWIATRQEDFVVTQASRETLAEAELAATRDGRFLGIRARVTTNLGAYAQTPGPAQRIVALLTGAYAIPAAEVEVSGVYTNTGPTGAYRGAGRPEAAFIVERLVEAMARALGVDSLDLRRRNFIGPSDFPYRNALGTTYDSGHYAETLERALSLVGYADVRAGQKASGTAGRELIGVGAMSYVEPTGGGWESGRVRIEADGRVTAVTGSVTQGQDHATTFAQIVADRLGVRFEDVTVRQGDTRDNLPGIGTFGSRSTALGGGALATVADQVYERGRQIAAHLLEAAPADIVARAGRFSVIGVAAGERSISWAEVVAAATGGQLPPDLTGDLIAQTQFDMHAEAIASGTCVAIVAIDPTTGVVRLRRLALVHDCGTQVNPRLVEAQLHGGLAQGVGEALGEWLRYDSSGQLLSGSLLDYWVPHADELPSFELAATATPSPLNPLGAKGVGEAGTIAAPSAIAHAVLDALRPLGVDNLELPFTPERVWEAIRIARERAG